MSEHIDNQYMYKLEVKEPTHERSYVYDLHYHIVFVTKYRDKIFTDDVATALKTRINAIADNNDFIIEAMEIMPNHVHLLISAKPKYNITTIVRNLKGNTARWLFEQFPKLKKELRHGHIWMGTSGHTPTM
jgi:putative transposase